MSAKLPKNKTVQRPDLLESIYIWGIKALIFMIPFISLYVSSSMLFPFITGKNFVFRSLVEVAAVFWTGLIVLNREYRLKNSALLLAVLSFTFIVGLAGLTGVNPYRSLWSGYERMEGYITILHLCLYFMMLKSVFRTRKDWLIFLNIIALVNVYPEAMILLQVSGYFGEISANFRATGFIGNSAFLAGYLMLVMFVKLILTVNVRMTWARIIYLALAVLDLAVIYYTATRGAMLALIVGLLLFSMFYVFRKSASPGDVLLKKVAAALIVVTIVVSIFVYSARETDFIKQNRVFSRVSNFSLSGPTVKFRVLVWGIMWEGVKERPILGWGQENALMVYLKHYNPEIYGLEASADRAHNVILDWLVSAGVLGLFSYLGIFGTALYVLWKAYLKGAVLRSESVIITTAFISYFFQNLFVFDTIITYTIFFALIAYIDAIELRVKPASHSARLPAVGQGARPGSLELKVKEKETSKFFSQKIKSIAAAVAVLLIVSAAAYFIIYKPIMESRYALKIMFASGQYKSYKQLLDDYNKALSFRTFGDADVVGTMTQNSQRILGLGVFNQEGALDFIRTTVMELERLVARSPGNTEYVITLANLVNHIASYDQAFVRRAEAYIKEGLLLSPKHPEIYVTLSDNYVLKNDFENAFLAAKKAVDLQPNHIPSYLKLALVAILASKDDVADSALETVRSSRAKSDIEIASGRKPAFESSELFRLARLSIRANNFQKALKFYKDIILMNPENAQYRFEIADVYRSLGDKENAVKEAQKAAEIDPSNYAAPVEIFLHGMDKRS